MKLSQRENKVNFHLQNSNYPKGKNKFTCTFRVQRQFKLLYIEHSKEILKSDHSNKNL